MIILPAIDIKDGNCVRLYKGEFNTVHKVAQSPEMAAMRWKDEGAQYLHIVDLDGSLQKKPINIQNIKNIIKETSLPVEIGGGIRTDDDVEMYISLGVNRVILGSAAISDPKFVSRILAKFPEHIAIGIDAKSGYVSVDGWIDTSNIYFCDLAKQVVALGAKYIIFTDISKDGTLEGAAMDRLTELQMAVPDVNIIASGGIRDISDIKALSQAGFYGAICGKSLYEGTLSLEEALKC
ncbi:MAG: 1-(5-phosphoribosyl)-5-[(5-phosphoribosylamino)methylideneamino]imidazole-4-carboxamide isomerase [Clostridiales bacterium]|nr:MAG: 1-(5-phosphoribosyl)-5-[(5-phosphoribosylamino)methylideneamino]imidazole-4-carboxamide isomerase [Clostridiales bacterium]